MYDDICRTCWWREGGRCYREPYKSEPSPSGVGRQSLKMADGTCGDGYKNKREVLVSAGIPTEMLRIASEEKGSKR